MDINILQTLVHAPLILKMINIYLLTTAYQILSPLFDYLYIMFSAAHGFSGQS